MSYRQNTRLPPRLSGYIDGIEAAYVRPAAYARHKTKSGTERIVADVTGSGPEVLHELVKHLAGPFLLLYVLHTSRGEGSVGRYQSPALSGDEINRFITRFAEYFLADGRFDLWVHSRESNATVVWDRHDKLFAYGPLDDFETALHALGFSPGEPETSLSIAYIHHYRSECDDDARTVLAALDWQYSPLKPEDEQRSDEDPPE